MKIKTLFSTLLLCVGGVTMAAELPFTTSFKQDAAGFTFIDGNSDGNMVGWSSSYGSNYDGCLLFNGSSGVSADEWIISPEFSFKAGFIYTVNYKHKVSSNKHYFLEWVLLKSATDTSDGKTLNTVEQDATGYGYYYDSMTFTFIPETDGNYYLGVHLTSAPGQSYYMFDDFEVSDGVNALTPKVPSYTSPAYSAVGDNIQIKFNVTAPMEDISNNLITDNLILKAVRSDKPDIEFSQTVAPGAVWEFIDSDGSEESVTYKIFAVANGVESNSIEVVCKPTFSKPGSVENLEAKYEGNGKFSLSWDPVITPQSPNGLFFPSKVTYKLVCNNTTIVENLTETQYSYTYVIDEDQLGQIPVMFYIYPVNKAGEGWAIHSENFLIGDPYTGEFFESFANKSYSTKTWFDDNYGSTWKLASDSSYPLTVSPQDGDMGMLYTYESTVSILVSPIINMSGCVNPLLKLYQWKEKDYSYDDAGFYLGFRTADGDTFLENLYATSTNGDSGWEEISVSLPDELLSQDFQILFKNSGSYGKTYIDNISLKSYRDHSLALTGMLLPETMEIGQKVNITANVENLGIQPEQGYSVTFYADDKELKTINPEAVLESQKSTEVICEFTALPTYGGSEVKIKAVLSYLKDEVEEDNTLEMGVFVNENDLTKVENLNATRTNQNVLITWVMPEVSDVPSVEQRTENFEGYEMKATEGKDGWIFTGTDKETKLLFGEYFYTYPTYDVMVCGSYSADYDAPFTPYNGEKSAVFGKSSDFSNYPSTDSWIISPEIAPGSKVSFFACGYHSYSAKTDDISLMYTTGSTELDAFESVATFQVTSGNWKEYSATLPSDAARFAIRFNGNMNNYNIAIDDIGYSAYGEPAVHNGFNVYRNDELIANVPLKEVSALSTEESYSYLDSELPYGVYTYYVTAGYDKGESMPSEVAKIVLEVNTSVGSQVYTSTVYSIGNRIIVEGAENTNILISDLYGSVVWNGTGDVQLTVTPGIYVVSVGGKAVKLVVK